MHCLATISILSVIWPFIALAGCTGLFIYGWFMMARRPERWAAMVERENAFWVAKGWVSAKTAAHSKKWETSSLLKNLAAFAAVTGVIGTLITGYGLARVAFVESHRVRMPFNPSLDPRWKPPPPLVPKSAFTNRNNPKKSPDASVPKRKKKP